MLDISHGIIFGRLCIFQHLNIFFRHLHFRCDIMCNRFGHSGHAWIFYQPIKLRTLLRYFCVDVLLKAFFTAAFSLL